MQRTPATKLEEPYPVPFTARSAVLLIFFMPPTLTNRPERASLMRLADSLQKQFSGLLRVLRIDEANHPDVVQSFIITQTPAFVLVRQGVELWRQEGLSDEAAFVGVILALLL